MSDHVLTLDYAKKMAQQIIFNQNTSGNALEGELEDLAKHIVASGVVRPWWWIPERRNNMKIANFLEWKGTSQGARFWMNIIDSGVIPPYIEDEEE